MNGLEQILIRMGVDAKAVVTGLNAVTITARSWANTISQTISSPFQKAQTAANGYFKNIGTSMLGSLKGFLPALAAGVILETLAKISEKISDIKRVAQATGANSNFIQSLMLKGSIDEFTMPLVKFSTLLGNAKNGMPDAILKLNDMGVTTAKAGAKTLTYTQAIHNLAVAYQNLKDPSQKAALLTEAFGRSGYKMAQIFNQGVGAVDKMNQNSIFKISPSTISDFSTVKNDLKMIGNGAMAATANFLGGITKGYKTITGFVGAIAGGAKNFTEINRSMMQVNQQEQEKFLNEGLANAAAEEGITVQEKKSEIINKQNELLQKQQELQSEIDDRGKSTIAEMAAHARKRLGIPEPQNYTVSAREREALRIDTLEKKSKIAFDNGDDEKFKGLRSEADRARAGFAGGTYKDRNPLGRTEVELAKVNDQLAPVKRMADLINAEHANPK